MAFCNVLSLEIPASVPGLISSWFALLVGDLIERCGYGLKK